MKARFLFSGQVSRVLVTAAVALLLSMQYVTAQSWFNPAWPYRVPLTITNSTATALTDYQVQVKLEATGPWSSSANDGSDLRFTAADGVTEIPYFIDTLVFGVSARIWVKVPTILASDGNSTTPEATVYMYYGGPSSQANEMVLTPPVGPFTKHPGNPGVINGVGAPGASENILPENIVYDPVTQKYWMVLSDQTGGPNVGLVYSDDPSNPDAWYWSGYPITGNPLAIAPHLIEYNGTWYIFYGDRSVPAPYPISVASSSSVSGPYVKIGEVLPAGVSGTWEDARADEPYVFQRADGTWVLIYMGDAGGNVEQVGYATASSITGPYTKYAGNPCIPFGPAGSYDAGTVADPWVYVSDGVYYIGYTVSPTTNPPWQTALATTTDWQTFTKHGLILPRGAEFNSFRGAVSRIGDQYVFSYTGGPASGEYRLCIATQPVFQVSSVTKGGSNGYNTFDFFDGFDGTVLDVTNKWQFFNVGPASVSNGRLTMTVAGTYTRIAGRTLFGTGYVSETFARHLNQGTNNLIAEFGFASSDWSTLRIVDDFPNITNWQRQAKRAGDADVFVTMGQTANQNWHTFHVYRDPSGSAGFQIDFGAIETASANIPTIGLPPFLMSYSNSLTNSNTVVVDWTRVRKWAGVEMTTIVGAPEFNGSQWTGLVSTDWHTAGNWIGGIPDANKTVLITNVTNQPVINATAYCDNIAIATGASLTLAGANQIQVKGEFLNNGTFNGGTGTVVLNGVSQVIEGATLTTFHNLTINCTDTVKLGLSILLTGDLNIANGVFNLGTFSCNHLVNDPLSGTLTVSGNAALIIEGSGTLPANFSSYVINPSGKVVYSGTDQIVGVATYGNLVLSGSGVKTFPANITVVGNTLIRVGAQALLSNGTTSVTSSLILGTLPASDGTWGSTVSAAGHRNDTWFSSTATGILTVNSSISSGTWLGVTSTNWNATSNWVGGVVPVLGTDVTIPSFANFKPVISGLAAPAECNNMTVSQGSTLGIDPGQALTVYGNLVNNGVITIESSWVNSNGSLIVRGTPSGTGTVSYIRFLREGDDTGDKHLLASPVGGQDVPEFISAYDAKIDNVRTWDEFNGTWTEVTNNDFISGKGYNIYQADASDGEFMFTGSLVNSATFTATSPFGLPYLSRGGDPYAATPLQNADNPISAFWTDGRGYIAGAWVNWGGGGWNLLGNPFTSAMNADQFITDNALDFDPYYQALYVYDGKNGYYRYVASTVPGYGDPGIVQGGTFGSRIQAGQGFMVMANNNNVVFNFNSLMQVHNTVLPLLKSAPAEDPWPGLKLKVKWGEKENMTTIVFNDEMKNSLDPGYDVGLLSTGPEVEIYTALVDKDESINLTRQAVPIAGVDTVKIPLGVDCYAGAEVTFSAVTVPLGSSRFWLEDRTTGMFTDLSLKSYTVTLPANTYGTGRFFIIASANTPTEIKNPEDVGDNLRIWVSGDKLIIKGDIGQKASCALYDIQGRRILERRLDDSELNTVDIPSGLHGVFMVRVIDGAVVTTRKIAVL